MNQFQSAVELTRVRSLLLAVRRKLEQRFFRNFTTFKFSPACAISQLLSVIFNYLLLNHCNTCAPLRQDENSKCSSCNNVAIYRCQLIAQHVELCSRKRWKIPDQQTTQRRKSLLILIRESFFFHIHHHLRLLRQTTLIFFLLSHAVCYAKQVVC